ncbi:MAG: T9SS type A sorting domain-containing protein [Candidatus Cloacimonetes bacterium]|nr:T9SS type A sorting domain-containing protein [Candidatus Cloacimonadota bacterium]
MKRLIVIVFFLLLLTVIYSQWSEQTSDPLLIAGGTGEQVIPKVSITDDGNIYISRFDNASGNYDVWLQKLDPLGFHLWDESGVLVSDHPAMSWLTDYDMDVDPDGNAVITFQDIRNVTNNIYAYKISPNGELLWTAGGVALTNDTDIDIMNASPTVLCTNDGSSYIAWQRVAERTSLHLNRLSPEGAKLWGEDGVVLQSPETSINWPQLLETDDGILLKYYIDIGPFWAPTRFMYIAKFDQDGTTEWTTAITTAGGITAWTQILSFQPDGTGGAVIAWHDDRNSDMVNEVYVQRVTVNGALTMPTDGALISTDMQNQQYYPKIAVDQVNQHIFAFYKQTNSSQTQDGMNGQLLDFAGNRLWGDTGMVIIPLSSYVASPIDAFTTQQGAIVIYEEGNVPNNDQSMQIKAAAFDYQGNYLWNDGYLDLVTTNTPKVHPAVNNHPEGWFVLSWEEDYDLYATRLNSNGTIAMYYPAPHDLSALAIEPDSIDLNWTFAYHSYPPETYQIFMNDQLEVFVDYGVTSYLFSDLTPGTYEFYLVANYPESVDSAPSETVSATISGTSVDDIIRPMASLLIHPNPIHSTATIRYNLNQPVSTVEISIINIKGQLVYRTVMFPNSNDWNEFNLDFNNLDGNRIASGIYFLKMKTGEDLIRRKIIILR